MAWEDPPTEKQVEALMNMTRWKCDLAEWEARKRFLLNSSFTRMQVSDEIKRVKELVATKTLNRKNAFKGAIWRDF